MRCPKCGSPLERVSVSVWGAKSKTTSYQCPKCEYFEYEPVSSKKVIEELRATPLRLKQKLIKLSQDRLGVYLSKDVTRSLKLKGGEDIYVSIPDERHIMIEIDESS